MDFKIRGLLRFGVGLGLGLYKPSNFSSLLGI